VEKSANFLAETLEPSTFTVLTKLLCSESSINKSAGQTSDLFRKTRFPTYLIKKVLKKLKK